MSTRTLLIELGTEELPVKALPELAASFADGIVAALDRRGVAHGAARLFHTPRRLAVQVADVAGEQPEQHSEVLGPYVNIALDANGEPTPALKGFAQKNGVAWTDLARGSDARGERFVLRAIRPGARLADLLPEVLAEAVKALPIPKPMRWGAHEHAFARPLHWLVVLYGADVVPATLMGVAADRMSRGHRFHHDRPVWLSSADDYAEALHAARVVVDVDARRARIVQAVEAAAAEVQGSARITDDNLAQVVCLTEWPCAVRCSFEVGFLRVPQEALISTMEANQKFFPVLDAGGRLTEHFIGIANIESRDVAEVRKGYERVIRPRFADAQFFFDEDLKQGLASMNAGLASVTYQQKLGTVADKTQRIAALAEIIAPQVGVDAALAGRAARLCKADLQSRMVGEFPELQGIAGRYYAAADAALADLSADDRAALALALDEVYAPRFAGDDIARSALGKVLAIAERLDTLAGGFAAGLKPTGNKDPFALRRNALGLARTVIESGFDLDSKALLGKALDLVFGDKTWTALEQVSKDVEAAAAKGISVSSSQQVTIVGGNTPGRVDEIYDFILDRLRGYYADKGVPAAHFNAVAELKPASLYDFDTRLDAIGTFATLQEAEALAAANKRIGNILKKADIAIPHAVDRALLTDPAESALAEAVEAVLGETDEALHHHDYVTVLNHLARLRPQVDAFFDSVMVNADDPAVRANRLALLNRLADRFRAVAAIEHLST